MSTELQSRVNELEQLVSSLNLKVEELSRPKEVAVIKKTKGIKKDGTERKKRAICGYMIYSNEKRSEVRDQLVSESSDGKLAAGAVVKELGRLWKELSDEEREEFNERAKEANSSSSGEE
jgi:hypothetical protein